MEFSEANSDKNTTELLSKQSVLLLNNCCMDVGIIFVLKKPSK